MLAAAEMRATVKYEQIRFTSASGQGYACGARSNCRRGKGLQDHIAKMDPICVRRTARVRKGLCANAGLMRQRDLVRFALPMGGLA